MKYLKRGLSAVLCVAMFAACTPAGTQEQEEIDLGTIKDYIAFDENVAYVYTGATPYDEQSYFPLYTDDTKVQRVISAFGLISVEILEYTDGVLISHMPANSHWTERITEDQLEAATNVVVLQEPLVLGASWETSSGYSSIGNLRGTSTITEVGVMIETPAGEFETFEVTTDYEGTNYDIRYYAKDVGLVRTDYYTQAVSGGSYKGNKVDSSSVLSEIRTGASFEMSFLGYYPDDEIENIVTEALPFQMQTNENPLELLTAVLRADSPGGKHGLISANTTLNSAVIDANKIVHVDFSGELPMEMNAGVAYEGLLIDSIALTVMAFYDVGDLMLTVDGKAYESGHFLIEEDHIFNYNDLNDFYIQKAAEKDEDEEEALSNQ